MSFFLLSGCFMFFWFKHNWYMSLNVIIIHICSHMFLQLLASTLLVFDVGSSDGVVCFQAGISCPGTLKAKTKSNFQTARSGRFIHGLFSREIIETHNPSCRGFLRSDLIRLPTQKQPARQRRRRTGSCTSHS